MPPDQPADTGSRGDAAGLLELPAGLRELRAEARRYLAAQSALQASELSLTRAVAAAIEADVSTDQICAHLAEQRIDPDELPRGLRTCLGYGQVWR